jgi:hypothetical protein
MYCSLFCIFPKNHLTSLKYPSLLALSLFDFPNSVITNDLDNKASNRRVHITNDLDDVDDDDDEEDEDEVWIGLVLGDGSDLQLGLGLPFQPHVDVVDHAVVAQVPALGELTARHLKRRRSISR